MKIIRFILIPIILTSSVIFGDDIEGSLGRIIADIDNYSGKTVTLELRLKHLDRIFEKIVFYDSENIDIEFDISGKERKKLLARDLMNLHEGMLYSVTFRIIGTGNLGGLLGEVSGFKAVVLKLIPENPGKGD